MKRLSDRILLFIFLLCIISSLNAQKPVVYDSPTYQYEAASELFQKEKYGSAQQLFKYVYENTPERQEDIKSNSYFYMGVCAARLYHNDAVFLLKDFIRKYPVHPFLPEAYYHVGNFYFYKKQYKRALENFEIIDERHIKQEDLSEYYFKKGYCYFDSKQFDQAKVYFEKVKKNDNGQYRVRASYYLAHIAYQDGQYQAALEGFLALQQEDEFRDIVPLYISQIYFHQERYDEVVAYTPPFLEKVDKKERPELERIVALSYYNLGKYVEAAPHFSQYISLTRSPIEKDDYFAIGYTRYQLKEYKGAIEFLAKTTQEKDFMAQNSFYIIGDCYLQTGEMALASQSFMEASKLDFSPNIKEDALYNYAKIQYATSPVPFNMAIKALENYINEYPNSFRSEEANTLLSSIYMSTKNYQAAITSLEKIRTKTPELLRAYQRCTYFRGLELINSNKNQEAVVMLNKSIAYPMNKQIRISALYWKAEAEYRANKYKEAFYDFQSYHKADGAKSDANYNLSFYGLGYSALKIDNYKEAQEAFRKYLSYPESDLNPPLKADAMVRLADAYYMEKDLKSAIYYYDECANLNQNNADYAIYQLAKCYGFQKNDVRKIEMLEKLILYYPKSSYSDDAEFELANTYLTQNNYAMAITAYNNFVKKYPKSPYIRQAYNKLALAYLNTQDEDKAISTFKYVFEKYPGSQEAKDALANLENIYTEQGNTYDFFEYIKSKNLNISVAKQDSIAYKAAENKYLRGDCDGAIKGFDNYLSQFPKGFFAAEAYFYKAECEYGQLSFEQALTGYETLLRNFDTDFNETALRKSATILFNQKEYRRALNYFVQLAAIASYPNVKLLAQTGIMHCTYALKQYREALNAAKEVLNYKTNDFELENEARLIAGRSALAMGDFINARSYLNSLASKKNNDFAAEAAYLLCYIEFQQGNYDECEKQITNMLSSQYSSDSEYWFASVFILYGDLYKVRGNLFQARHTYQSIVDNYEGEDLVAIAQSKIDELDVLENRTRPEPEVQEEESDEQPSEE